MLVAAGGCRHKPAKKGNTEAQSQSTDTSVDIDYVSLPEMQEVTFHSPDLAFNQLQGRVATCQWGSESDLYTHRNITYNPNGNLERESGTMVYRNNDGQIVRLEQGGDDILLFDWEDGRMKSQELSFTYDDTCWGRGPIYFHYNTDGMLAYTTMDDGEGECGKMRNMKTTYSNYVYDEVGNWISRKSTTTYQLYDEGAWRDKTEHDQEVRVITYYDSDIGKERINLMHDLHEKAMEDFEKKLKEEQKKGPEWLNGTWKFNGTLFTQLGAIDVHATLKIDRKNGTLVCESNGRTDASGSYYVENGKIYCKDMYFDIDYYNETIDYGDHNYFYKVSSY